MNNTLIFLRHAKTIQDKSKPSSQWRLAETGKKTAKELAASGIFDDVDIVISSNEKKLTRLLNHLQTEQEKE